MQVCIFCSAGLASFRRLQLTSNVRRQSRSNCVRPSVNSVCAPVRPNGKYLLIQMRPDGVVDAVTRLTEVARNNYPVAFRSHTGRWEPLLAAGDLQHTASLVATLLAPILIPDPHKPVCGMSTGEPRSTRVRPT